MNPYGRFRPDQPGTVPGISRRIIGAIPTQDAELGIAYRPYQKFNTAINATELGADPRGAISIIKNDGSYAVFVATATAVRQMQSDYSWTDIDSGLSISADDDRSFAHFGIFIIYTDTSQGMRAYNVEAGGAASPISGVPNARYVFVCNETLIALDVNDDNRRWQNSALGNHTNWTTREADGDQLEDGGALVAGIDIGNGSAIVAQEDATRLFRVGGGQSHVSVVKLADGIGSVGERSMTGFNGVAYWLDRKGFFMSNGGAPVPIGSGKVSRTFLASLSPTQLANVSASVDPENEIVWWLFDGVMYGYQWAIGEWTTAVTDLLAFFRMATPGYTLNSAGALGTLNQLSAYPLNSSFWRGGAPSLAGIGADGKVGFFDGVNMAAELDTALMNSGTSDLLTSATILTDDLAPTLAIATTDMLGGTLAYGPDTDRQPSGRHPIRGRGKNISFRVKHAEGAAWTYDRGTNHGEGAQGGPR